MKTIYSRIMLAHDYYEEAMNYIDAGMTKEEIAADVRQIFADNYETENDEIVNLYIKNLLEEVEKKGEGRKYWTAAGETGDLIDSFDTKEEAEAAIREYEEEDLEEGNYTPDFYEVIWR